MGIFNRAKLNNPNGTQVRDPQSCVPLNFSVSLQPICLVIFLQNHTNLLNTNKYNHKAQMTKKFSSILCLMLFMAFASMAIISCGDNDDVEPASPKTLIIGTWTSHEHNETSDFIFNADGTYQISHKDDGAEPNTKTTDENGCWRKSKGAYTVTKDQLKINQTQTFLPEEYGDKEWHNQEFSNTATIKFSNGNNTLTMTSKNNKGQEEVNVLYRVK